MYYLKDVYGDIVIVYFISLIILGAFALLNLTLAIMKVKFSETT